MTRYVDDVALLLARLLIAVLFAGGAVQKLFSPQQVAAMIDGVGLWPDLVGLVAVLNGGAALALVLGVYVRPVAFGLAIYCGATSYFHWIPDDPWQMTIFVKNWAIAGGCLALMVAGGGRFALWPREAAHNTAFQRK